MGPVIILFKKYPKAVREQVINNSRSNNISKINKNILTCYLKRKMQSFRKLKKLSFLFKLKKKPKSKNNKKSKKKNKSKKRRS